MTTKLQCYRIAEHLESVETESVHEAIQAGKSPLWLDIESTGKDALKTLLSLVEMNPVMAQCCRDAGERPRAIPCDDAIFFELPVYTGVSASGTTSLVVLVRKKLIRL